MISHPAAKLCTINNPPNITNEYETDWIRLVIKKNTTPPIFLFTTFLLSLAIFAAHTVELVSQSGKIAIYLFLLTIYLLTLKFTIQGIRIQKIISQPIFFIVLLVFAYILSSIASSNFDQLITRLVQLTSALSIIYVFYIFGKNGGDAIVKKYVGIFFYSTIFMTAGALINLLIRNDFGLLNNNLLGMWAGTSAIIILSQFRNKAKAFAFSVPAFLLVTYSESRTALGAMTAALLFYFSWPLITRRKYLFYAALITIFSIAALIILLGAGNFIDISDFNDSARATSGKNITSGREVIWPIVIAFISQNPWLGWGAGGTSAALSDMDLSAHNFYLQTLLQIGVVGLFIFILYIFSIWKIFWKFPLDRNVRWAASLFVYVLLCQNFEVTFLQNNISLSWPMWCFVALSIGSANRNSR